MEFYCLWLARLNLPPAPGSAAQQAYHTNLGPWDQVFNPRGSRRHWPKEHVDCSAFFGHCSQAQAFQPLPSFQLLVPFHLPGHGAVGEKIKKRGRQQDCIISQNSTWSYKQSKVGFMNLIYLRVFQWFPIMFRSISPILHLWCSILLCSSHTLAFSFLFPCFFPYVVSFTLSWCDMTAQLTKTVRTIQVLYVGRTGERSAKKVTLEHDC